MWSVPPSELLIIWMASSWGSHKTLSPHCWHTTAWISWWKEFETEWMTALPTCVVFGEFLISTPQLRQALGRKGLPTNHPFAKMRALPISSLSTLSTRWRFRIASSWIADGSPSRGSVISSLASDSDAIARNEWLRVDPRFLDCDQDWLISFIFRECERCYSGMSMPYRETWVEKSTCSRINNHKYKTVNHQVPTSPYEGNTQYLLCTQ